MEYKYGKTHIEEQEDLLQSYLNIHCFNEWRIPPSQKDKNRNPYGSNALEMMISPVCNTACSYCYMKNYSDQLYPCGYDRENLLHNCERVMRWLIKEKYYPSGIEIFSGEFFNLPFWKEYLNIIFTYLSKLPEGKEIEISIPTNATFIFSESKTAEIQNFLDFSKKEGFKVYLSLSVDGKYLDNETRPLKNKKRYNDAYYDKLFKFAHKNNYGFHPMVGAKGIENWIQNFDWYVENICKYYEIATEKALNYLYLLEVRNPDWKTSELESLSLFLEHVLKVLFEGCKTPEERFNRLKFGKLNIFSSIYARVGRGLGCSFQRTFAIRIGDLALIQCHRTAYRDLVGAYLNLDVDGNMNLKGVNINSYIMSNSFDFKYLAKCCECPIGTLCNGPCIGCNYEVNKDLYTVVPTVCDLEFTKIVASIKALDKIDKNVLNKVINLLSYNQEKQYQIENLRNYIELNKEN